MDPVYPQFGHYSAAGSQILASEPASPYEDANISATNSDGSPPIIQDFYSNANGTQAFSYASTSFSLTPSGDTPAKSNFNTSSTYAQTVAQVLNMSSGTVGNSTYDNTWETKGYAYTGHNMTKSGTFAGYTLGPGYWGKTFYIWPPDPTKDWRTKYFNFKNSTTAPADNSLLWNSSGNWQAPQPGSTSGYQIDYTAILNFINNVGPQSLPRIASVGADRLLHPDSHHASTPQPGRPPTSTSGSGRNTSTTSSASCRSSSNSYVVINPVHRQRHCRRHRLRTRFPVGDREDHRPEQPLADQREAVHALRRQPAAAAVELLVRPA